MNRPVDRAAAYRIFAGALEAEAGERDAFVAARCGDAPEMEAYVCRLLAIADSGAKTGILVAGGTAEIPERIGREYGRFRLIDLLGVGGMGAVYRAERIDGVPQTVAVKVLRDGISAANDTLFSREARILAGLEHSSIARLIDAGVSNGEGWIAMEFVRGEPITAYCDRAGLDLPARVRLLITVADAVATAHRRLIVHRDIKPSNVLVGDDGNPKLIDFGIAYALQRADGTREPTTDVSRLFSPHYAAPEQVKGEPVTVATDVFGLGALGYRLLSGCEPFAKATSVVAYLIAVTQNDVELPSRAARESGMNPGQARRLAGDIDSILMKALERNPAQRYRSIDELQGDLQAYLNGQPVSARAASWPYRLAKFASRHAWGLGFASVAAIGLVTAGTIYALQERRIEQARESAARRGEFLESMLKSADPRRNGNRDMTVVQLLNTVTPQISALAAREPLVGASMLSLVAETNLNLGQYAQGLTSNAAAIDLLRAHGGGAVALSEALAVRGQLLMKAGRYREAEAPLREAIAKAQQVSGAEKQLAEALNDLGAVYQDSEREAQAETAYRQSIDVYRTTGIEFGPAASDPIENMGVLRYNEGRYDEAAVYMRDALAIRRKYLAPDHPDLLDAEYNYASILERNHRETEAEPIYRRLAASYQRSLGPDNADALMAQIGLAQNLIAQQRYAEAAGIAQPAAQSLSRVLGDSHDWTQTAWGVYGFASCLGGKADAGLPVLRRVASLRQDGPDANQWRKSITETELGACLTFLRNYAEAEPILSQAITALERARGADYSYTQQAYRSLHELYQNTGRPDEAARVAARIRN